MIDWDALVLAPCQAVFGEKLKPSYQRASGGAPFDIDGIFDDAYAAVSVEADDDPGIAMVNPVLGVRLAQFAGVDPVQSDKVTIPSAGKKYVVIDVQPDGHGAVKLILAESAT
jgi:hypothetical protein